MIGEYSDGLCHPGQTKEEDDGFLCMASQNECKILQFGPTRQRTVGEACACNLIRFQL